MIDQIGIAAETIVLILREGVVAEDLALPPTHRGIVTEPRIVMAVSTVMIEIKIFGVTIVIGHDTRAHVPGSGAMTMRCSRSSQSTRCGWPSGTTQ